MYAWTILSVGTSLVEGFFLACYNSPMPSSYFIVTFGCASNVADSERVASELESKGYTKADTIESADHVVINTCMVRQMAEDRTYGLYQNLIKQKAAIGKPSKIVVTGCMVGTALREPTGKFFDKIRRLMPQVDEFLPIEEVGFDHQPLRLDTNHAWVPISNGCNNFCTFCVVPFSRGREISRPFDDILQECQHLADQGYQAITLVGQNVNSYGADLILGSDNVQTLRDVDQLKFFNEDPRIHQITTDGYQLPDGRSVKPTIVKHLGKMRIPTLFPQLLETICQQFQQFTKVDFISSNPWDFSDDLIDVIAKYPQVTRQIHLPIQSGSDRMLKKMNRWYSTEEYLTIISKLRSRVPEVQFSTDIIVGFPDETEEDFQSTYNLAKQVGYYKAYVSRYSPRPGTAATQAFVDNIPHTVKKDRWQKLESLING